MAIDLSTLVDEHGNATPATPSSDVPADRQTGGTLDLSTLVDESGRRRESPGVLTRAGRAIRRALTPGPAPLGELPPDVAPPPTPPASAVRATGPAVRPEAPAPVRPDTTSLIPTNREVMRNPDAPAISPTARSVGELGGAKLTGRLVTAPATPPLSDRPDLSAEMPSIPGSPMTTDPSLMPTSPEALDAAAAASREAMQRTLPRTPEAETALAGEGQALTQELAALDQERQAISREHAAVAALGPEDSTREERAAAFNARVDAFNRRVDAAKAHYERFERGAAAAPRVPLPDVGALARQESLRPFGATLTPAGVQNDLAPRTRALGRAGGADEPTLRADTRTPEQRRHDQWRADYALRLEEMRARGQRPARSVDEIVADMDQAGIPRAMQPFAGAAVIELRALASGASQSSAGQAWRAMTKAIDRHLGTSLTPDTLEVPGETMLEHAIAVTGLFAGDYAALVAGGALGASAVRPLIEHIGTQMFRAGVAAGMTQENAALAAHRAVGNSAALRRIVTDAFPQWVEQAAKVLPRAEAETAARETARIVLSDIRALPSVRAVAGAGAMGGAVVAADATRETARQLAEDGAITDPAKIAREAVTGLVTGAVIGAGTGVITNELLHTVGQIVGWGALAPLLKDGRMPTVGDLIAAVGPMVVIAAATRVSRRPPGSEVIPPTGEFLPRVPSDEPVPGRDSPAPGTAEPRPFPVGVEPGSVEATIRAQEAEAAAARERARGTITARPRPAASPPMSTGNEPDTGVPPAPVTPRPSGGGTETKPAPVVFAWWRPGYGSHPAAPEYHLTEDIPGHPVGSTVSRTTLEREGYVVPEPSVPMPQSPEAWDAHLAEARRSNVAGDLTRQARPTSGQPEPQKSQLPDWVAEDIKQKVLQADQAGVSDRIEALSAERLTATQVARRLVAETKTIPFDVMKDLVQAVRADRGIPSMDDAAAFEQWLASRISKGPQARPSPTTVGPLLAQLGINGRVRIGDDIWVKRAEDDRAAPGLSTLWEREDGQASVIGAEIIDVAHRAGWRVERLESEAGERTDLYPRQGEQIPETTDQDTPAIGPATPPASAPPGDAPETARQPRPFTLPRELAGARPRYGYGARQYELDFQSDLDKALYIVAQEGPSRRDSDYMRALGAWADAAGVQADLRSSGRIIRDRIKEIAKEAAGQPSDRLTVPPIAESLAAFRPHRDEAGDGVSSIPSTTAQSPEGYQHAERLRALVTTFEQALRDNALPKDPRELRALVARATGLALREVGADPALVDDLYDAIEAAINRVYRERRDPTLDLAGQIERALETEEWLGRRTRTLELSKRQQFSTPLTLAEGVVYALDLRSGDTVLEPTAGTGNLVAPLPPDTPLQVIELDPRRVETLRAQGYDTPAQAQYVNMGGFADYLRAPIPYAPDLVVTNPPWGKHTTQKYGAPIPMPYGAPVDVAERFFVKALRDVRDGGRVAAIMPTTILKAPRFLRWLEQTHTLRAVIMNPPHAYDTRGTTVPSVTLVVDKGRIADAPPALRGTAADYTGLADLLRPLARGGSHARVGAGARGPEGAVPSPAVGAPVVGPPGRRPDEPAAPVIGAGAPPRPAESSTPGPAPDRGTGRAPEARGAGMERPAPTRAGQPRAGDVSVGAGRGDADVEDEGPAVPADARRAAAEPTFVESFGDERYSVADPADLDAARRSAIFVPAPQRRSPGVNPHPRLIVRTRSLAGAKLPVLTVEPQGRLIGEAYARKVISDQQLDYIVLPALQADQNGHGYLAAADVGVGKSRAAAALAGEWLETGRAKRLLYVTYNDNNVQDVIDEFNVYAGGTFPYEIIQVRSFPASAERRGKATDREPLPVTERAVYVVDYFNLTAFERSLTELGVDGIIGDEAHKFKNVEEAAVGKAWSRIQRTVLQRHGPLVYMTATPAVDFEDMRQFEGLREWAQGGFDDYILRMTGASPEAQGDLGALRARLGALTSQWEGLRDLSATDRDALLATLPRVPDAEHGEGRWDEAVDALRAGIDLLENALTDRSPRAVTVGGDANTVQPRTGKRRGFGSGRDVFSVHVTPAEQEQIMRELAMKGKFDAIDLWRAGVEFEVAETPLTPEQRTEYAALATFLREVNHEFLAFGRLNDSTGRMLTIRHFLQQEVKRRIFDYRLGPAIEVARAALARGEQPVISLINVSEGSSTHGPIPAAINTINVRQVETDDTGEIVFDEEIPEAVAKRQELLERWAAGRQVPDPIERILAAFGRENVTVVTGDISAGQRRKMIREFQDGIRKVAVISGAGKTGISLHHVLTTESGAGGRRHLIVTDPEWSADSYKQELGRVDRSGQLSSPKITLLSTGTAAEKKFLATIANRMRNLGALSKGSAEAASNDKLAEFELGGNLDTHAMRLAYRSLDPDIQQQFLSSNFRDPNNREANTSAYPQAASLKDFLLDVQFLQPEAADQAFTAFWREREKLIAAQEAGAEERAGRTRAYQGTVARSTTLRPDLTLHEVKDDHGHAYGILQGIVTPHLARIARFLEQNATGLPTRRYVTFRAGDRQIAGLEIRPGSIQPLLESFGKAERRDLSTPDKVREALEAGVKVVLSGRGGYVLRQRPSDRRVHIMGATMADRAELLRYGAAYHPAGNFFFVQPDRLEDFLSRWPVRHPGGPAGASFMSQRARPEPGESFPPPKATSSVNLDAVRELLANDQGLTRLSVVLGRRKYPVASLADASERFSRARDQFHEATGRGSEGVPQPLIVDDAGAVVGYVSYNGKVWAGRPEDWTPGGTPLYNPYATEQPAEPRRLKGTQAPMAGLRAGDESAVSFMTTRPPAPTFYSAMELALEQKMPSVALPSHVLGILRNTPGVKADEVRWSGLEDWLRAQGMTKKVPKAEVLDYLRANNVRIEETVLGASSGSAIEIAEALRRQEEQQRRVRHLAERLQDALRERGEPLDADATAQALTRRITDRSLGYLEAVDQARALLGSTETLDAMIQGVDDLRRRQQDYLAAQRNETKKGARYERYTLPGGEHYREILLRLPTPMMPAYYRELGIKVNDANNAIIEYQRAHPDAVPARDDGLSRLVMDRDRLADAMTAAQGYRSAHFDEPNVIVHIRVTDRVDHVGHPGLFAEEIQSDWHEEGRKRGYRLTELPDGYRIVHESVGERGERWVVLDDEGRAITDSERSADDARAFALDFLNREMALPFGGTVPPAPFAKTWHELAFRRLVRLAAEEGKTWVGWTTGEQQAERYDLSQHITGLQYQRDGDEYRIHVQHPDLDRWWDLGLHPQSALGDLVGKDLALRIVRGEGERVQPHATARRFSGLDLKIGGEGMKGFYDKILVDYARKFAKKWGTRVEERGMEVGVRQSSADLTLAGGSTADAPIIGRPTVPVHMIDITPAMRESVLYEGQPAFMARKEIGGEQRATASMDPRLLKVLAGNLYKGNLASVATKEMLQNAIDSMRGLADPSRGRVRVTYDSRTGWLTAQDTGEGMTPEVASAEFVDIGGSKKYAGMSGGFGIAKVAILANADAIKVVTRATDPARGGIVETTLTGTGEDWADPARGLTLATRPADDLALGTEIAVQLRPHETYAVEDRLRDVLTYHRLPFALDFQIDGRPVVPRDGADTLTKVETVTVRGAAIDFWTGGPPRTGVSFTIAVLNYGLPQFGSYAWSPSGAVTLPSILLADVRATAGPESPDYPFSPSREELRSEVQRAITEFHKTLVARSARAANARYRELLDHAPTLTGTLRIVDTSDELPSDVVAALAAHERLRAFTEDVQGAFRLIQQALGAGYAGATFTGVGLGGTYLGINLSGRSLYPEREGVGNLILVNPFTAMEEIAADRLPAEEVPQALAAGLAYTILHELTHEAAREHDQAFAGALTRNGARTLTAIGEAYNGLVTILENDHAFIDWLARTAIDLRARYRGGGDVFKSFAAGHEGGLPEGGPQADRGNAGPAAGRAESERPGDSGPAGDLGAGGGPRGAGSGALRPSGGEPAAFLASPAGMGGRGPRSTDALRADGYEQDVASDGRRYFAAREAEQVADALRSQGRDTFIRPINGVVSDVWSRPATTPSLVARASGGGAAGGGGRPPAPPDDAEPPIEGQPPEEPVGDPADDPLPAPPEAVAAAPPRLFTDGERREFFAEEAERIAARLREADAEVEVRPAPGNRARRVIVTKGLAAFDSIRKQVSPVSRGRDAQIMAGIVREGAARATREFEVARYALRQGMKMMASETTERQYALINLIEQGRIDELPPEYRDIAQPLREALDERRAQVQALGTGALQHWIKDYFPHIWKRTPDADAAMGRILGKRPLEGPKSFLKQRTLPTFMEGIDAGLTPVSTNPVTLTLLKIREMDRYILGQKIFAEMKAQGLVEFVRFGQPRPEGSAPVNDKITKRFQYSETEGGFVVRGEYMAPEPAARILNNYLSPGLRGNALYDGVRGVGNLLNMVQLGFSFFHAGFVTMDTAISAVALGLQETSGGDLRGALDIAKGLSWVAVIDAIRKGSKVLSEYYAPGSQGEEVARITEALVRAGGRAKMERFYSSWDSLTKFNEAWHAKDVKTMALHGLPAFVEAVAWPTMEWLVPRVKLGVFYDMARFELARLPETATDTERRRVLNMVWDSVDNRLGQVVYDNVFWDHTFKDLMMVGFRSVGWNWGTIREVLGGGVRDLPLMLGHEARAIKATLTGEPIERRRARDRERRWEMASTARLPRRLAYILGLVIVNAMTSVLYQYAMTGEGPQEAMDLAFAWDGKWNRDGTKHRVAFPTYMKDVFAWRRQPLKTLEHKLHPLITIVREELWNTDYRGGYIRDPRDPVLQQLWDSVRFAVGEAEPYAFANFDRQMREGAGTLEAAQSFVGITAAPGYVTRTPEQAMDRLLRTPEGRRGLKFKRERELGGR